MSLRSSPKTSHGIAKSKVSAPWSIDRGDRAHVPKPSEIRLRAIAAKPARCSGMERNDDRGPRLGRRRGARLRRPVRGARRLGAHDGASPRLTVAERADEVRCAHGLRLCPTRRGPTSARSTCSSSPAGTRAAGGGRAVPRAAARLARDGTLMTSVCTGALVFAAAGLLEGRPATTHWSALEPLAALLRRRGRPEARFVDTGEVVTAAGVSAGIDMALHLVARLDSVERAQGCGATSSTTPNLPYDTRGRDRRFPGARGEGFREEDWRVLVPGPARVRWPESTPR